MKKEDFWKNFDLGNEVQLSGNLIYDGLLVFDQMESFYYVDEIFEFLYFISVGIERLLKVNIILIEHVDDVEQKVFENSLISHSHISLLERIKNKYPLNFERKHLAFIQILTVFYKNHRYERFSMNNVGESDKLRDKFCAFLGKCMSIKISNIDFNVTPNNNQIKSLVGKIVGEIINPLYDILYSESSRLNLYTYEIRTNSKAYKIFVEKDFTFERERLLQREIIVHLLSQETESGLQSFIKENLSPIDFDNGSENLYIKCMFNFNKCAEHVEELDARYEDLDNLEQRKDLLSMIGSDYNFEDDEEIDKDYF